MLKQSIIQNAQNMSLPFLISQLIRAGYSENDIAFQGVAADYSSKQLIADVMFNDSHVNVGLHSGWLGAQSKFKSLFEKMGLEESPELNQLVNKWVASQVCFLHPELDKEYQSLYSGVNDDGTINPISFSQLYRQLAGLFSAYHFDLIHHRSEQDQGGVEFILGDSHLGLSSYSVLGVLEKNENILEVLIYVSDDLSVDEITHLRSVLIDRWIARYGMYWSQYQLQLHQRVVDSDDSLYLPCALGSEELLQAENRMILDLSIKHYLS